MQSKENKRKHKISGPKELIPSWADFGLARLAAPPTRPGPEPSNLGLGREWAVPPAGLPRPCRTVRASRRARRQISSDGRRRARAARKDHSAARAPNPNFICSFTFSLFFPRRPQASGGRWHRQSGARRWSWWRRRALLAGVACRRGWRASPSNAARRCPKAPTG